VPDGHNAQACNDVAMAVLKRYDIRRSDIVLSINDITNTSLATSRLIVGTDGTCNMHLANLACDHATGKRKRTVNKEIVDSFEECEDLRLAVCRMIGYVWNKKAKSRKINYEKRNEQIGYNVIKVGIDNDTRISGYARMYHKRYGANGHCTSTLLTRSRWCVTPTSYQTNVGSPWLRSRPSYDQFAPYHSRHRSTRNWLLALVGPILLRPRLPLGK
jgi:hypothetical protein